MPAGLFDTSYGAGTTHAVQGDALDSSPETVICGTFMERFLNRLR